MPEQHSGNITVKARKGQGGLYYIESVKWGVNLAELGDDSYDVLDKTTETMVGRLLSNCQKYNGSASGVNNTRTPLIDPGQPNTTCPRCGAPLKTVPAGVSKTKLGKDGQPVRYPSFLACSNRMCKYTENFPATGQPEALKSKPVYTPEPVSDNTQDIPF